MARLLQGIITKNNLMKQPLIVVNKSGGAGAEGFLAVKDAKGDAHTTEQKNKVESQVDATLARLNSEPKPLAWRLRERVGDRVKWYKDVDEV